MLNINSNIFNNKKEIKTRNREGKIRLSNKKERIRRYSSRI